jgi:hypothetical protein
LRLNCALAGTRPTQLTHYCVTLSDRRPLRMSMQFPTCSCRGAVGFRMKNLNRSQRRCTYSTRIYVGLLEPQKSLVLGSMAFERRPRLGGPVPKYRTHQTCTSTPQLLKPRPHRGPTEWSGGRRMGCPTLRHLRGSGASRFPCGFDLANYPDESTPFDKRRGRFCSCRPWR